MTLETWKRRHLRSAGARLFVDAVTRAVLTSEPRDVSFLFFLSYLRWGNGLESLISIKGGVSKSDSPAGAADLAAVGRAVGAARGARLPRPRDRAIGRRCLRAQRSG